MLKCKALEILNMQNADYNFKLETEISQIIEEQINRHNREIYFRNGILSELHPSHSIIPRKKWFIFSFDPEYENELDDSYKGVLSLVQLYAYDLLVQWGYRPKIICFCYEDYCDKFVNEICLKINV